MVQFAGITSRQKKAMNSGNASDGKQKALGYMQHSKQKKEKKKKIVNKMVDIAG